MQVVVGEPGRIFRVQRDGPSPAEQAQLALQQEVTAEVARVTREIQAITRDGGPLTAAERGRLEQLRTELRFHASQLRELEQERREHAIEDAAQAMAARAVTGAAQRPSVIVGDGRIPREAVEISIAFFIATAAAIILFPLMRSLGRVLERRAVPPQRLDASTESQLRRMEQAIDAVAIEVERVAEGQRFTAKLLADRERAGQLHG